MRVHHLNCGTLCPVAGKLLNGVGRLVCHCLLLELDDGLALIDTGLGVEDVRNPTRLGSFRRLARPELHLGETAVKQVEALGFRRGDVRHIAVTHLDIDHVGGIADFPGATVHLLEDEMAAAVAPSTLKERKRYRYLGGERQPWLTYDAQGGEPWFGFDCVRELEGLPPEVLLVPLPGHTRGHTGVAIDTGAGWLLHCGDAYFFHGQVATPPSCPPAARIYQSAVQHDSRTRQRNIERLRQLRREHGGEVTVFCAHDPTELG